MFCTVVPLCGTVVLVFGRVVLVFVKVVLVFDTVVIVFGTVFLLFGLVLLLFGSVDNYGNVLLSRLEYVEEYFKIQREVDSKVHITFGILTYIVTTLQDKA